MATEPRHYQVEATSLDISDLTSACNEIARGGGRVVSVMCVPDVIAVSGSKGPGYVIVGEYET